MPKNPYACPEPRGWFDEPEPEERPDCPKCGGPTTHLKRSMIWDAVPMPCDKCENKEAPDA